jgi:hypothetical protein
LGGRGVPNPAGNSATSSGMNAVPLAQNTPALRLAHRRAGVSGGKEARMLMEVDAGLPAWFGGVGGGVAFPIRRVILRWCLGNSVPLAQNTPALRLTNRRAGVSGGKEARMLMEVDAGLPAGFGNVGVARRSQSGG